MSSAKPIAIFSLGTTLALLLSACGGDSSSLDAAAVGGEVDENGCRASAGYQWCEFTEQCERPWELAEAQGFENTPEAYGTFCTEGPPPEDDESDGILGIEPRELPDEN